MNIELSDVWKTYPKQSAPAIQGISLTMNSGRITAVAGQSGSGKTTLLRLIAGFEKPDRGRIKLDRSLVVAEGMFLPPQKRSISMIFQDLALFPHLTAEGNVAFGMTKVDRKTRRQRARDLLGSVGLKDMDTKYPHELSGGQRQRVALARALASEAEIILMDEPFSNLDPELKSTLMNELRSILKREEKTAVLVTHDREEAFAVADDIAVVHDGTILQAGTAADVYLRPVNHTVARFFGPVNRIPTPESPGATSYTELLVRPEHCTIGRKGEHSHNSVSSPDFQLNGTVNRSRFMGAYWEIEVIPKRTNGIQCKNIIVYSEKPRNIGDSVRVAIPGAPPPPVAAHWSFLNRNGVPADEQVSGI